MGVGDDSMHCLVKGGLCMGNTVPKHKTRTHSWTHFCNCSGLRYHLLIGRKSKVSHQRPFDTSDVVVLHTHVTPVFFRNHSYFLSIPMLLVLAICKKTESMDSK